MFKKNNNNNTSMPSYSSSDRSHSILSSSATVVGEITSQDDLRIDGNIEGNVNCAGKVIVGVNGCIKGNIKSKSIELMGKIYGDVTVTEIVRLMAASYFKGEITAQNLEIESGAMFFGNCKMAEPEYRGVVLADVE